jgi:hypothetical protein
MTLRRELADRVAEITGRPLASIDPTLYTPLQRDELLPRGGAGRSNLDLSASHRINLFLGAALDRKYGTPVGESVRRWRSLSAVGARYRPEGPDESRAAIRFVEGLGIVFHRDLGTALDGIVASMSSGAFAKWAADDNVYFSVQFFDDDYALLVLNRPNGRGVSFGYGDDKPLPPISRTIRVDRAAFERLAQ